jgi:hypothetical protein
MQNFCTNFEAKFGSYNHYNIGLLDSWISRFDLDVFMVVLSE